MADQYPGIDARLQSFIEDQHIFFVGTAAQEGRVNVSPKGMDSLRVLGPNRILWRNVTGSGNETAGHLLQINRMTLMWCSFTTKPMILRAYGTARTIHPRDAEWDDMNGRFTAFDGARQIYDMTVEMMQSSCGYAVPFFDAPRPRDTLEKWTADKGVEGIETYWADKNQTTLDGAPTGILDPK